MSNTTTATFSRQNHDPEHARVRVSNNNNNNNIYNLRDIIIINDTVPSVSDSERRRQYARAEMNARREEIIAAYEEALECPLRATVANLMVDFIAADHSIEQLLEAIERTGFASRPSPQYLRTVLRNWDSYAYTPADRVQRSDAPSNPALQYEQRDYNTDEFAEYLRRKDDEWIEEARRLCSASDEYQDLFTKKGDSKP